MSIVIPMEMPECCIRCRFETSSIYGQLCRITGKHSRIDGNENGSKRHADCPLVELPELHGDLIDRDKLAEEFEKYEIEEASVFDLLFDAPTILEASEE